MRRSVDFEQLKQKYLSSPPKKVYDSKHESDYLRPEDFDYLETKLSEAEMNLLLNRSDRLRQHLQESAQRTGISFI